MELHNFIGNKLQYAFDTKAGFLVSFPEEIGAGGFGIEAEVKGKKVGARTRFGSSIAQDINSVVKELSNKLSHID
jgi:hypothetical protein